MTIMPGNDSKHYIVRDPIVAPEYLLGCQKRRDGSYLVEANYLNCYQLGISFNASDSTLGDVTLPGGLHDYQVRDVQRMVHQRKIYNANRMGYGKTVEGVAAVRALNSNSVLVLAPKAVLSQWAKEFRKWWPGCDDRIRVRPTTETAGRGRGASQKSSSKLLGRGDIVITNYEALQNPKTLTQLKSFTWDAIILDESHRIKNRKSKRWASCLDLPGKRKICLSGTPILRRVDDLWAQWFFLDWKFSGLSYWNFVEFFCEMEHNEGGHREPTTLSKDPKKIKLMNWLVDLVCIRNDDLKLTKGKVRHVIDLKLDGKQKQLYSDAKELCYNNLPENLTISSGMSHILRLRQITSTPEQFDPKCNNAKFDWIEDMMEDNPDEKFVIFSNWSTTIDALAKRLGSKSVTYTGNNSDKVNDANKEKFISRPQIQAMCGTIGALGTGVDGLQQVCSIVVFIDKDWSPEINQQAEDRLNRPGQKRQVSCYYLEGIGTFDRHVSRINVSKAEDIRKALMDEEDY